MALRPGPGGRSAQDNSRDTPVDLAKVATISIDGQILALHSWSISGFRSAGYKGRLHPGQKTIVRVMIPVGEDRQTFEMMAEIDQRDVASGLISGSFLGLSKTQVERMNAIFARRLSGRRPPA